MDTNRNLIRRLKIAGEGLNMACWNTRPRRKLEWLFWRRISECLHSGIWGRNLNANAICYVAEELNYIKSQLQLLTEFFWILSDDILQWLGPVLPYKMTTYKPKKTRCKSVQHYRYSSSRGLFETGCCELQILVPITTKIFIRLKCVCLCCGYVLNRTAYRHIYTTCTSLHQLWLCSKYDDCRPARR